MAFVRRKVGQNVLSSLECVVCICYWLFYCKYRWKIKQSFSVVLKFRQTYFSRFSFTKCFCLKTEKTFPGFAVNYEGPRPKADVMGDLKDLQTTGTYRGVRSTFGMICFAESMSRIESKLSILYKNNQKIVNFGKRLKNNSSNVGSIPRDVSKISSHCFHPLYFSQTLQIIHFSMWWLV